MSIYIYGRTRVSVLMTLSNATQGVVFPRKKGFFGGYLSEKTGLGYFGMCRNNKIKCFLLIFSFSGPRKYLVRGPSNRSTYIQTEKSFCLILQISTLYFVKYLKDNYHPQNKADNTKYMTTPFIPLINSSFTE